MSESYPPDWDERRQEVYREDNYTCQNCGREGGPKGNVELHAHHVVPKSKGGTHRIDNLTTLCSECHKAVHADIDAPTKNISKGLTNEATDDEGWLALRMSFNHHIDENTDIEMSKFRLFRLYSELIIVHNDTVRELIRFESSQQSPPEKLTKRYRLSTSLLAQLIQREPSGISSNKIRKLTNIARTERKQYLQIMSDSNITDYTLREFVNEMERASVENLSFDHNGFVRRSNELIDSMDRYLSSCHSIVNNRNQTGISNDALWEYNESNSELTDCISNWSSSMESLCKSSLQQMGEKKKQGQVQEGDILIILFMVICAFFLLFYIISP